MSRIEWAKYVCDVCGIEQPSDLNPHHDRKFDGWVRYSIDRIYNSKAYDGGHDGHGELCPRCFAETKIKFGTADH